ncbi:hypothetical protein LY90DRAFT_519503 [Neocallimastix californiae]|uniref:Uncharacterized protein n=1 Tax=Neocallimastix californiae TaxID=1754190 RepID=A0A1Y1YG93_9FUNG|nr:hypothetical protein LY90DRAFT_520181 [Neocallimastix californiae]ORY03917.1 hypothetical protein LY90DRAFT_519503 [Neocallimastix californiae]|eukprot:ORX96766.1 hypothetical protein LY90DRAFT_520181 [Neocallimastix californiae]
MVMHKNLSLWQDSYRFSNSKLSGRLHCSRNLFNGHLKLSGYKKSNYKKLEINDFNIIYNEYYKKLRSRYAYDFILNILKLTFCYEDNIYKFKINIKNHSEYNVIPNLLVDYEYSNEYIRFLESIIEFYDAGLNYKYNGLIINNFSTNEDKEDSESENNDNGEDSENAKSDNEEERNEINNLNDLYHNFYNIKLTNNKLYEIDNENKNFFCINNGHLFTKFELFQ